MDLETADAPVVETAPVEEAVEPAWVETTPVEPVEAAEEPKVEAPAAKDKPKGPSDSLIGELTAQRARRREAESRAEKAERELAEFRAMVAAKEGQQPTPRAPQQPQNVNDEVGRQVALRLYERDIAGVVDRGQREFGAADFNAASQRFAEGVGDGTVSLAREIMDIAGEKSHKVIYDLSQDLDRALALRDMPQTRRILAINEMANMAESKPTTETKSPLSAAPTPKPVSKAPPPAPAIRASTTTEKPKNWWWSDKTSDADFDANFWENQKNRRGMRR